MKVILLNGKIGSGKTSVGKALHRKLLNSALIEGDSFLQINPFNPTNDNYVLVAKNIVNQIKTYSKFKNVEYVIVSWLIRNEEIYHIIKDNLNKFDLYQVYLDCPLKTLKSRVLNDIKNNTRFEDNILKIEGEIYKENFISIKNNIQIEKVVSKIIKMINN